MEFFREAIDFVLHLDTHLYDITSVYGLWTYAILFLVIFCETGLVVTPFLPGDSLLFAAGAIAALGAIDAHILFLVLAGAAILGDSVNYSIGYRLGPKVFHYEKSRLLNREYLERTHKFYEKHGGKTIVIARFLPIIRTFAPFVAGIGRMTYRRFISFNVFGGVLWVGLFLYAGYYFGQIPFIKQHFSIIVLIFFVIPGIPAAVEFTKHFINRRKKKLVDE